MVVCPRCGTPQPEDQYVIAERDVKCSYCEWSGSSKDLITVDPEKVKDPRVFDLLADWLRDTLGQQLASGLYIHGLIPVRVQIAIENNDTLELATYLTKVIRTYVAGIMAGVMDPNVLEAREPPVDYESFLYWFAKNVEKDFTRGLIQLGVVKMSMDPKNIRYITKLNRFAARRMWGFLVEELKNGGQGQN